jgi:hypothetical protein
VGIGGGKFIMLVIYLVELVKEALEGEVQEKGWVGGGRGVVLLGFVALMCVWVHFCCCSVGCLCHRLQEAVVVYIWYSNLVCGW